MSHYINNINNITTLTDYHNPTVSESSMPKFMIELEQLILNKKLKDFRVIGIDDFINDIPLFKPSLNTRQLDSIFKEIQPGELVSGKSTTSWKVMVYMAPDDGSIWEIVTLADNIIRDVEFRGYKTKNEKSSEIDCMNSYGNDPFFFAHTNVRNNMNSNEYKMIVHSILSNQSLEPIDSQTHINKDELLETVKLLDSMNVKSWKVVLVKSNCTSHVFLTKDNLGNTWMVVTNHNLTEVTDTFNVSRCL